jgi:hypothetical protein
VAPGLLAIDRRFLLPGGLAIPTRSFIVELAGNAVAVISPLPDGDARAAVARLGRVAFLIAPNSFHYLGIPAWAGAFPDASIFLAPGLAERRPELGPGCELRAGASTPFCGVLAHEVMDSGQGVSEVAFLHRPSRTLILTDACFHILEARPRDRLGWRLLGAWRRFGPSRTARFILLRDRARVTDFARRLCRLDFERIAVAHGEPLEAASAATLREAFRSYLPL